MGWFHQERYEIPYNLRKEVQSNVQFNLSSGYLKNLGNGEWSNEHLNENSGKMKIWWKWVQTNGWRNERVISFLKSNESRGHSDGKVK